MTTNELKALIREIVAEAQRLSIKYTSEKKAPVNYACLFSQNADEYESTIKVAHQLGSVVKNTTMGPVFHISPFSTAAGTLGLLKIRKPDPKRKERGDADFTIANYKKFKKTYLGRPGFNIIKKPDMEMIELIDSSYNVIVYYSNPTLADVLKLNN